jgi:hypothetical protein
MHISDPGFGVINISCRDDSSCYLCCVKTIEEKL